MDLALFLDSEVEYETRNRYTMLSGKADHLPLFPDVMVWPLQGCSSFWTLDLLSRARHWVYKVIYALNPKEVPPRNILALRALTGRRKQKSSLETMTSNTL